MTRLKGWIIGVSTAVAILAMPFAAGAQGIGRGAAEGSDTGNRVAGPVGGLVGGVVGGAVGGASGAVKGVLGIPQRTDYRRRGYRDCVYRHGRRICR